MKACMKVLGLPELAAALKALPAEIASKNGGPLRTALRARARKIRDRARLLAPKRMGRLARAIVIQVDKHPGDVTERMVVRPRAGRSRNDDKGAWYWHFNEFGTVNMPAHPFIRPAVDQVGEESLQDFKRILAAGIVRAVRKARKLNVRRPGGR